MRIAVVAKPGRLRDGLLALLSMMPKDADLDRLDDAASLLHYIRNHHPDLVLLDSDSENRNGFDALRTLKTEKPSLPCLVIVSNARQEKVALGAGADGLLLRGFSSLELEGAIRRLLN